jgi:hypothetical protein
MRRTVGNTLDINGHAVDFDRPNANGSFVSVLVSDLGRVIRDLEMPLVL